MNILIKLAVNAVALWIATLVVGRITLTGGTTGQKVVTLIVVAAIFAVVNTIIKPIVFFFSLPLIFVTLGLFIFVVNALMLLLTSWIAGWFDVPFQVHGFGAALLGALVISFVSFLVNWLLPDRYETR